MADTDGDHITNTFRFCHHTIPVPGITATDRILDATARLTAAIEGVQEAPPDELAAIQALRTLLLGEVPPTAPCTYPSPPQANALRPIIDEEPVVKSEKYKRIWERSFANELGRLFQGIRNIPGTDTCFFRKAQVPKHKRATYGRIVCNVRPQKEEIYRT